MSEVKVGQIWRTRRGELVRITEIKPPWHRSQNQTGIAVYTEVNRPRKAHSCWLGGDYDKKNGPFKGDWDLIECLTLVRKQRQLQLL